MRTYVVGHVDDGSSPENLTTCTEYRVRENGMQNNVLVLYGNNFRSLELDLSSCKSGLFDVHKDERKIKTQEYRMRLLRILSQEILL